MTKLGKKFRAISKPPIIKLNNQTGIPLDFSVGEHKGVTMITLRLKEKPEESAAQTQSPRAAAETA